MSQREKEPKSPPESELPIEPGHVMSREKFQELLEQQQQ